MWLLTACAACGAVYWLLNVYATVRILRAVPLLSDPADAGCHGRIVGSHAVPQPPTASHVAGVPHSSPAATSADRGTAPLAGLEGAFAANRFACPKVSVIIPACNEADTLDAAMASRLADDYPNLEFILIDDRSIDDTGAIVDRIAATDPRVRPLHIDQLPEGWLGKVHALHRGVRLAAGEWLLFTDADVHFAPGMIRLAVAHAQRRRLDHLAAFPAVVSAGLWLDVTLAGFLRLFLLGTRAWAVEDPRSRASIGIGAFNLVRRDAFEQTEGFPWLKLEIGDDVALGTLLKRSGFRSGLVNARDHLSVRWYGSVREMAVGSERGGFTVLSRFRLRGAILAAAVLLALEWSAFLPLLAFGAPTLQLAGALLTGLALGSAVTLSAWGRRPILPALLLPVASFVLAGFVLRAGYLGWRRGGICWRGTLYTTDTLRAGARVRFP